MTAKNGLPCVKCGTSEWRDNADCKECARRRARKRIQDNREMSRRKTSEWKRANPDKVAEYNRRDYQENRDRRLEHMRRYYTANSDKIKGRIRQYQQRNPDKHALVQQAAQHRRRTKKTKAGGSYTAEEFKALCTHYGNKCLRCGRKGIKLEFDHVIPVSKGGTSNISNGQPLCRSCNASKSGSHIDYRPDAGPLRWTQPALLSIQHG